MKGIRMRRGVFWFRGRIDGEVVQWSLGTSDEAQAILNYRRKRAELRMEQAEVQEEIPKGWKSAVAAYMEHQRGRGNSRATLDNDAALLLAFGRDMEWSSVRDVTTASVEKWMQRYNNQRTRFGYLEKLHRFLRWAKVSPNPCAGIERPRKMPRAFRKRFLSREEAERVLATPYTPPPRIGEESARKSTISDEDLKFALYCALHAGLRKGEVCAARPNWFDVKAGLLHVLREADWRTKDQEDRTIPLTKEFVAFLRGYGMRSPYMLKPEKKPGKHLYRVDFKVAFRRHMKTCGISGVTFHDLRRTFASLHVSSGTPLFVVAKWLGDGLAVTERHYGHLAHDRGYIEKAWEK